VRCDAAVDTRIQCSHGYLSRRGFMAVCVPEATASTADLCACPTAPLTRGQSCQRPRGARACGRGWNQGATGGPRGSGECFKVAVRGSACAAPARSLGDGVTLEQTHPGSGSHKVPFPNTTYAVDSGCPSLAAERAMHDVGAPAAGDRPYRRDQHVTSRAENAASRNSHRVRLRLVARGSPRLASEKLSFWVLTFECGCD
jgi:hypothetical protein